jgi:chaperonin cofactor prefoldin
MAQQIKKKFIGNNEVDGSKVLLDNNQAIRSKDQAGVEQDILKLDASDKIVAKNGANLEEIAFQPEVDAIEGRVTTAEGEIDTLQSEMDAVENDVSNLVTLSGAGPDAVHLGAFNDGIIPADSDIKEALQALESAVDAISGGGSGSLSALQQELDDTQLGAGLEVDGSYIAPAVSNYLAAAVSLKDADSKLDSEIKVVADDLAQEVLDRGQADSDLQDEIDATQLGAGLGVDGSYTAPSPSNYLTMATSLFDADSKLDSEIKIVADAVADAVSDLQDHINASVDAHDASAISFNNAASGLTAINAQDAIDEVEARVDTAESDISALEGRMDTAELDISNLEGDLSNHLNDAIDAHDASAISLSPAINGQTDVQSSLADHESRIAAVEGYDTDDIEEGINNLYFTDARARTAAVADSITDGVANIAPSQNAVHDALALKLDLAGGTMSGNIAMGNNSITNLVMTSDAHSAATREYVDNVAEGLHIHSPVRAVRSTAIAGTYDNGVDGVGATFTPTSAVSNIDGLGSFAIGQRIILNAQANNWENGIYTVSAVDGSNHVTEFTRAIDFDSPEEVAGGDFVFVQAGSTYANTGWVETKTTTALGFGVSDEIAFLQFSGAGAYTAGDGLDLTGTIFSVNVSELVGDGIEDDGSNNFKVKVSDIAGAGLEDDGSNNLQIAASAAGDALSLSAGVLSVNVDNSTIEIATDSLQVKDAGIVEAKLASLSVSTAKIQDDAVDKSKIASDVAGAGLVQNVLDGSLEIAETAAGDGLSLTTGILSVNVGDGIQISSDAVAAKVSDFAGDGLEDDLSNNLKIKLDTDSALAVAATGLKVDTSIAGDGLDMASGVMSVNVSDIAGDGLESDGGSPANLRIKLDGSSLAVSASGLKSNVEFYKEKYSVTTNLTTGAFFDLAFVAEVNSISAFVDRLAIHEGASEDFTVSYTGGVGGVTRITFVNELVTPGQSQLSNGDSVYFKYQKKIS